MAGTDVAVAHTVAEVYVGDEPRSAALLDYPSGGQDLNSNAKTVRTGFDTSRFHAFFTTTHPDTADTVAADKTHRGHANVEQVHADLRNSAHAHLPSGKFTANAAWLVPTVKAFDLPRLATTVSGPELAKATTAIICRDLIAVPTRVASSGRRLTLHLAANWPWQMRTSPCDPCL